MKRHREGIRLPCRNLLQAWLIIVLGVMPLVQPVPALAQDDDLPLDVAAMTLRPHDLEAEGVADHGLGNSILTGDPAAVADFIGFWRGADAGETIEDAVAEAEPDQAYVLQLVEPGLAGDLLSGIESRVVSYVFAFPDDDAASKGFAVLGEAWATDGMEETDTNAEIGEEQLLVEGSAREESGTMYQRVDLLFRLDRLVSGVSVEVYDVTPPEPETVEALAERQADRVDTVLDDGGPGLSQQILRVDVPGRNAVFDTYSILGGKRFRRGDETADEAAENQAGVDEAGAVDQYEIQQQIVGDALAPADLPLAYVLSRIVRFADADAASTYLQDSAERLETGGSEDIDVVTDVPDLGDEVAAYTYTHTRNDGVIFNDYRIYVRIDADFFTIALNSTEEVDLEAVNELAERQAACLTGDASCVEPEDVPRPLQGVVSGQGPATGTAPQGRVPGNAQAVRTGPSRRSFTGTVFP